MMRLSEHGKRGLLLLLWGLIATSLYAEDEGYIMYVNLADGTNLHFVLSEQKPYVVSRDGKMTVYYGNYYPVDSTFVDDYGYSYGYLKEHIVFECNQVRDIRFDISTGVENIDIKDDGLIFDVSHAGIVRINGLKAKDFVEIYSLDGKKMSAPISKQNMEAIIDLSAKPRGIYIISINKRFTFKMMKP